MAIAFSAQQATNARYFYERLVYTLGATSLPAGITTLCNVYGWNPKAGPTMQARLEMLQATQNTAVQLSVSADPGNALQTVSSQGYTSALRANYEQEEVMVPAINSIQLQLNNLTGGPVAGWQTNYAVAMRRLTAADKIMYSKGGYVGYTLTSDEKTALKQLDLGKNINGVFTPDASSIAQLVSKGTLPLGLDRVMQGVFDNHKMSSAPDEFYFTNVSTTDNPFNTYRSALNDSDPTKGSFGVVTEIAIEGAPNVVLTMDRDNQLTYFQVLGQSFLQTTDTPWKVFIPFLDYATFHITTPSGLANASVRIKVERYGMSDILAVLFGRILHPSDLTGDLYYKVIAGVW